MYIANSVCILQIFSVYCKIYRETEKFVKIPNNRLINVLEWFQASLPNPVGMRRRDLNND